MTVFDVMNSVSFTHYSPVRGGVHGFSLGAGVDSTGVFKYRKGANLPAEAEAANGQPSLHVRPIDEWVSGNKSVMGDVVLIDEQYYEVIGQTEGRNFDSGETEHYTLTLQEVAL